jgi:hypothetical protein
MRLPWIVSLFVAGCAADSVDEPPSVAFSSPAAGATFTRGSLGSTGALVADVGITVETTGDVARVAIAAADVALGDADAAGALAAQFGKPGAVTLTATAFDAMDAPLATATVAITIADPQVADCKGWLDLYDLEYTIGPTNPGISDPITVKVPLNGVSYRYSGNTAARTTLYGDCSLMKSLAEAAPIMRAHAIKEVEDIGIYNYRCIGGGTPPNCPNGISQHAYAKAIDIAAWITTDNTKYSVLTDWVIDPADDTCNAATDPGKDTFLHQVICELKTARVWNIVLTPNYNADHRNHFHVDMTPNANFITRTVMDPVSDLDGFLAH